MFVFKKVRFLVLMINGLKCFYPDTHFYDLQEDGTILCDKKADCPADVPDQVASKHKTLSDR